MSIWDAKYIDYATEARVWGENGQLPMVKSGPLAKQHESVKIVDDYGLLGMQAGGTTFKRGRGNEDHLHKTKFYLGGMWHTITAIGAPKVFVANKTPNRWYLDGKPKLKEIVDCLVSKADRDLVKLRVEMSIGPGRRAHHESWAEV